MPWRYWLLLTVEGLYMVSASTFMSSPSLRSGSVKNETDKRSVHVCHRVLLVNCSGTSLIEYSRTGSEWSKTNAWASSCLSSSVITMSVMYVYSLLVHMSSCRIRESKMASMAVDSTSDCRSYML